MIALALALLAVQGLTPDSLRARAESSLAAGDVRTALKLATKLVERRPRDARAHFLLGRVHYARPIIGRYPALEEFRRAARLDPTDPAPVYWQMKVGFYLRSDEGEVIARDALLRLFAVSPDYLDAWQRFGDVYQNRDIWERAERALARHGAQPVALAHRAEMLIALGQATRADSLLQLAMAGEHPTTRAALLRAEASFLAGRDAAGYAWHDSAVARAGADSSGALWNEVWSIATPEESRRHEGTPPGERRAFFERFWSERDPNLLTPHNERVREHYARRAEARRMYRLLHPQRSAYHSPGARALHQYAIRQEIASKADPSPSTEPFAMAHRAAVLRWQQEALQDTAMSRAGRAGLTAQGLVFLRYGRPDMQAPCMTDILRPHVLSAPRCTSHLDQESWLYWTPHGPLGITFTKAEYLLPLSSDQLQSARVILRTDRTTLPAPLEVRAWSALFRGADLGLTDVYYRTSGDSAAAVLWDTASQLQPVRASGPGLLLLSVPPGPYRAGVDVDSAGRLGRSRRDVVIPYFSDADLDLSSLVLAPSSELLDREAALHGMPVDLVYPAGKPLASYVEIYGLTPGRDGRSHYQMRYSFEPVRSFLAKLVSNARAVVFEFDRETDGRTSYERLIIEPDRLSAGRYRVTLSVTDLTRNVKSESAQLEIEIR